ncbi:MAG TPA: NAD-dependent epimerase/dehydratase family protein [Mycobacteriales bacterium]|nr:NAD-dependent epimerase/dehydratase family protein [Mycobacteriales bacterium]HVW81491.1 NAD-dependent epimerase/dehydratase family protein [Mycobacteriales bacterium]
MITGGAGFIGANLAREFVGLGIETAVIDDFSTGYRANLDGVAVDLHEGSILDAELLRRAAEGAETIVHLAARGSVPRSLVDPVATHEVNATGTLNVLEAARTVGAQVIFASSSSVYGSNPAIPKHEQLACAPMSPYAASKLAAESYVLAYQQSYGVPALAFRFFNVYGPLQAADHAYAAVVPRFVSAVLRQEPVTIYGDGLQTRDFTSVKSVTSVITDAVKRRVASPTPVNLAFGTRTSILDLLGMVAAITGIPSTARHEASRTGDVRDSQADSARLHELFPSAHRESLEDGLAATIAWFQSVASAVR